jgi:hypothetical protein
MPRLAPVSRSVRSFWLFDAILISSFSAPAYG